MPGSGYPYVCESDALKEGVPQRFEAEGVPACLVLTGQRVFAVHDVCSHSAVSLSEGEADGLTVECRLHGSRFDCAPDSPSTGRRPVPSPCTRWRSRTEACSHMSYWRAVYDFFRRWRTYDYVRELHERLRRTARERSGRNAEPSAGIIDSQSVDASETVGEDSRGYDGGKSRDGRKRHVLTDTDGLLLEVTVTTADVHDSKAAPALLETFMDQPGRLLKLVWVDSAYQGPALAKAFARHGVRTEVVRRCDGQRGFVVLARRWVVERTLSWLSRSRRLNRDHERRPDHHAQMVWWAAVIRLSRRLAGDAPRWPEKRPGRLLRARA